MISKPSENEGRGRVAARTIIVLLKEPQVDPAIKYTERHHEDISKVGEAEQIDEQWDKYKQQRQVVLFEPQKAEIEQDWVRHDLFHGYGEWAQKAAQSMHISILNNILIWHKYRNI